MNIYTHVYKVPSKTCGVSCVYMLEYNYRMAQMFYGQKF